MTEYLQLIGLSLVGGVVSLVGGFLLLSKRSTANNLASFATPFAAGALLGVAFLELIPEAFEETGSGTIMRWALVGVIAFFLLEHFLHWFHHHHEHAKKLGQPTATLVIIGDTVHNFIDGIAIAAAFLINPPTGIVTAIAVAAHEIPQEIGDFGLLLKLGFSRKRVIIINVVSALATVVAAVLTYWLGTEASLPTGQLLAVTAGLFIYIAASDLIPTIHERVKNRVNVIAAILLLLGVLTVGVVTEVAHNYIDDGHSSEEAESQEDDHADE